MRIVAGTAALALALAFVEPASAGAPPAAVVRTDPAAHAGSIGSVHAAAAHAESTRFAAPAASFEHVPADAGVSNPVVYAIHADRTGFLWFGTMYGLVRFDGREYRTFRHDPYDSTSLSHDDVVAITEDSLGDLWIGTWGGGADRYDRARGRFDRFLPDGADST
ncbi:MAG TPA: two-component regulator propeller domain-containing protein, partial [Thermoanaerobaculia bacterium]|nr:two-component regulator propeller domain-containing protein [Thermoanaerobaculia bacterium]